LLRTKKIGITEDEIQQKIKERQDARAQKDWQRADAIRDELSACGIVLEDTLQGTVWRVKI
jgi:cysteinyl-tRNA synthetase